MTWWRRLMPWLNRGPSKALLEAEQRLAAVTRDDERVDRLASDVARTIRENNLGPSIMDALGLRRQ